MQLTLFSDPGCPWAWSAGPAFATLQWRYGDQLQWRLVMIGLSETAEQDKRRGYTREWAVFRALQFGQFSTRLRLEEQAGLEAALAWLPGVDAKRLVEASFEPET